MALPKLEAQYTIPANCQASLTQVGGGTAGPTTVSFAEGTYYLADLVAYVKTRIEAAAGGATYTVTIDDTADTATGKITITKTSAGTFTLAWSLSTELRGVLGFAADLTPTAASFLSPSSSTLIWLPNVHRSDASLADGNQGEPVRTVAVNVAPSGAVYAWASASQRYENVLEFTGLKGYKALTSLEVTANESLQRFFESFISKGQAFRYHADRSVDATYNTFNARQASAERFNVQPQMKAWRGAQSLWSWRCEVYAP